MNCEVKLSDNYKMDRSFVEMVCSLFEILCLISALSSVKSSLTLIGSGCVLNFLIIPYCIPKMSIARVHKQLVSTYQ